MGIMDMFKKKDPGLDIDSSLGLDSGTDFGNPVMNSLNQSPGNDFNQGFHDQLQPSINLSSQQFQPAQQMQSSGGDLQKDIQILSLKLDAIKAELDSMNQRIKNIETIAEKEQVQQPKKWY
jgi:hypothetical protein